MSHFAAFVALVFILFWIAARKRTGLHGSIKHVVWPLGTAFPFLSLPCQTLPSRHACMSRHTQGCTHTHAGEVLHWIMPPAHAWDRRYLGNNQIKELPPTIFYKLTYLTMLCVISLCLWPLFSSCFRSVPAYNVHWLPTPSGPLMEISWSHFPTSSPAAPSTPART